MDDVSDVVLNKIGSKEVIDLTQEEEENDDSSTCIIEETKTVPLDGEDDSKGKGSVIGKDQKTVRLLTTVNSESPLSSVKTMGSTIIPTSSKGNFVSSSIDSEHVIDLSGESTPIGEKSPSLDLSCGIVKCFDIDRERGNNY
jgi:hypothetical protein